LRQTSGYVWLHEHYHTCSKMYVIASFQKCPRHGLDRVRPLLEFSSAACDPHLAKDVRRTPTWACSASSCSLCKEQLASHHLSHQSSQSAWTVTSVCSPKPLTICLQFQLVNCVPALIKPGRTTHWHSLLSLLKLTTKSSPLLLTVYHCRLELAAILSMSQTVSWIIPCRSPAPHCLYIISLSRTTTLQQ